MVLYIFRRESPFCFLAEHGQLSGPLFLSYFYKFVIRLEFKCHIKFQNGARELSNLKKSRKKEMDGFYYHLCSKVCFQHML